ncbi:FAD-binding protein [Thermaurantimonas aggregans]|nr:FAD-binding protein [Thermaurantimonas aggregans]MCX8149635.1 FAD-binding protein [Thermaurantimonas aggregans]
MKNTQWDKTYDVVVVGSGAGALTAALTAIHQGLRVVILEKTAYWGGSSAYSGGGLWIPANFLMKKAGALDSPEEALEYMNAVIGEVGPASTEEKRKIFLKFGPEMVDWLTSLGFKWVRAHLYPDYYPNVKGAKTGRVIEGAVFDGKKLGPLAKSLNKAPGMPDIALKSGDAYLLPMVTRSWKGFSTMMRILGQTLQWKLTGKQPLTLGRSLCGQLMYLIQKKQPTEVWLNSPLKEIISDGDSVVGVVVERDGKATKIKAEKAIILAAGGFPHNKEMRKKYHGLDQEWSSATPGNTGDAITAAESIGAATDLMDDAWWGASFILDGKINFSVTERSMPGCILVDQDGFRFANESTSYVDLGHRILEHHRNTGKAIPCWLIMDGLYRKRYLFGMMPPGLTPKKFIRNGEIIKADSLESLARQCNIPYDNLKATLVRFNSFALHGKDEDFGRGQDIYDRYYSDDFIRPNSNLAPITTPPFYAIRFYPGDLGTKGGLLTDEFARVLRKDGTAIKNLYATGNTTASVMGRTYPGPGSTLGPACTFGYIAVKHLTNTL